MATLMEETSNDRKGSLDGRLAVITGGASGIGQATCQLMAQEGASVVLVDINREGMDSTVAGMVEPSRHLALVADITKLEDVDNVFTKIKERYGRAADICVNAAGIAKNMPFLDITSEELERFIGVHLKGTFMMMQAAAKDMIDTEVKDGSIVNFSSIVARTGLVEQAHYSACKGAIVSLTLTVAKDLAKHGIRVNCVRPGMIDTPILLCMDPETKAYFESLIPLQRCGKPKEVAEVVTFLASTKSSYMTGAAVDIDAGLNF